MRTDALIEWVASKRKGISIIFVFFFLSLPPFFSELEETSVRKCTVLAFFQIECFQVYGNGPEWREEGGEKTSLPPASPHDRGGTGREEGESLMRPRDGTGREKEHEREGCLEPVMNYTQHMVRPHRDIVC